jgi:hypothetical protein
MLPRRPRAIVARGLPACAEIPTSSRRPSLGSRRSPRRTTWVSPGFVELQISQPHLLRGGRVGICEGELQGAPQPRDDGQFAVDTRAGGERKRNHREQLLGRSDRVCRQVGQQALEIVLDAPCVEEGRQLGVKAAKLGPEGFGVLRARRREAREQLLGRLEILSARGSVQLVLQELQQSRRTPRRPFSCRRRWNRRLGRYAWTQPQEPQSRSVGVSMRFLDQTPTFKRHAQNCARHTIFVRRVSVDPCAPQHVCTDVAGSSPLLGSRPC